MLNFPYLLKVINLLYIRSLLMSMKHYQMFYNGCQWNRMTSSSVLELEAKRAFLKDTLKDMQWQLTSASKINIFVLIVGKSCQSSGLLHMQRRTQAWGTAFRTPLKFSHFTKNWYFKNYAKTIYMHWFDYDFLSFKIHGDAIYLKDLKNIWMSKYIWCHLLKLYMNFFLIVLPAEANFCTTLLKNCATH